MLCFETWAVRAIVFWKIPFTDLNLGTSLVLRLIAGISSFSGLHGSPNVTGMSGKAFNGGAERQYLAGWTAVPIRNIGGVERA